MVAAHQLHRVVVRLRVMSRRTFYIHSMNNHLKTTHNVCNKKKQILYFFIAGKYLPKNAVVHFQSYLNVVSI